MLYQQITCNASGKKYRYEEMDGKRYLVAPMAMITEGVFLGTNGPGPLYYPESVIRRTISVWNAKPTVVNHPSINGMNVSACDPQMITDRSNGMVMNTHWKGKLRADAWIDEAKSNRIDKSIVNNIKAGSMTEVSTGVFLETDNTPGEYKGKPYVATVTSMMPDHLAFLPNSVGACSIKDGAGLLQTNMATSHRTIREAICEAMQEKFGEGWYGMIVDVFDKFFIYAMGPFYSDDLPLFQLDYKMKDGVATIGSTPVSVRLVQEYRTPEGVPIGNSSPVLQKDEETMARKEQVDALITNGKGGYVEADRAFLMGIAEDQFVKIHKLVQTPAPTPVPTPVPAPAPVGNQTPPVVPAAPMTLSQLLANADPAVQESINEGMEAVRVQKEELLKTIIGNVNNQFSEEYLRTRPLPELRGIAALAKTAPANPTPPPMFRGQALPNQPVGNATPQKPLVAPSTNPAGQK